MTAWEYAFIILGVIVAALSIVGTLAGAIWYLSSMWHEVKGIRQALVFFGETLKEQTTAIWTKVDKHGETLQEHGQRITRLEAKEE